MGVAKTQAAPMQNHEKKSVVLAQDVVQVPLVTGQHFLAIVDQMDGNSFRILQILQQLHKVRKLVSSWTRLPHYMENWEETLFTDVPFKAHHKY